MTQSGAATIYKDLSTGIIFDTWSTSSGMTLGLAIPQNGLSTDATEFIGILVRRLLSLLIKSI
jgi:cellobiose dehydrogenase (acceptor)